MDIRMTGIDGLEATRRIVARGITTRVLVLTTFDADDHVYETRPSMGQTWDGEVGTSRISHLLVRARGAARRFAPRRGAAHGSNTAACTFMQLGLQPPLKELICSSIAPGRACPWLRTIR
jgi:DNA-binding response OmpR family regulator